MAEARPLARGAGLLRDGFLLRSQAVQPGGRRFSLETPQVRPCSAVAAAVCRHGSAGPLHNLPLPVQALSCLTASGCRQCRIMQTREDKRSPARAGLHPSTPSKGVPPTPPALRATSRSPAAPRSAGLLTI